MTPNGALGRTNTGATGLATSSAVTSKTAQYESESSEEEEYEDEEEENSEEEDDTEGSDEESDLDSEDSQAEEVTEDEAEQEAVSATLKAIKARSAPIPTPAVVQKRKPTIKRRAREWYYVYVDPITGKETELIPKSSDITHNAVTTIIAPPKDDSDKPQPSV